MAPCYDFVRRTLVAVFVSLVASAATAAAQSMYLDANGDGVHTSADVVPVSGTPWTFDVWLTTDRNREGDREYCEQTADSAFTLRGYAFVLHASNGTVTFHDVTNRIPELTLSSPSRTSDTELVYGRYAPIDLPSGRYRLATITAEVAAGTPAITIEPSSGSGAPAVLTSFESSCWGEFYDGLLKLGMDWFDADGLPYGGQENRPPQLQPISPMTVAEGDTATQSLQAMDPDGDGITLSVTAGPSYVMVIPDSGSPGLTTGLLQVMPGYFDSGAASGSIRATDGFLSAEQPFTVTVTNVSRPPVLEQPPDQEVEAGTQLFVPLTASDPDGEYPTIRVSGPPFASLGGQSVLLAPDPREPEGIHPVTVTATDGEFSVERTFSVTVFGTKHPPVLEEIEDMVAVEGYTVTQDIGASDPDADHLTFTPLQFLPSMRLEVLSAWPSQPMARIILEPREGDRGQANVSVSVSDGFLTDESAFTVSILERHTASTFLAIEADPRPPESAWDRIRFGPRDGVFHAAGTPGGATYVTFAPPTSVEQDWQVMLACLPAQRAQCYSDPHYWNVTIHPPLGQILVPGVYEHVGNAPDSTHAALRVGQYCGALATCATVDSWFEIKQVQYGPGGQLLSLWARFARRCAVGYPLSGEVRYHAALPAYTDPPTRIQAHAGTQLRAEILVGGTSPGIPMVTSPDLPAGAILTPVSNGRIFLEWTPALEQSGLHDIRLITSIADAEPDTSAMTVCVDIPGAVAATMDANRTEVITSTRGDAAYAASYVAHGAYHPSGSGLPVAHSAKLLVAARVNGEVRIAQGGSDFVPGPMSGGAAAPFELRFKNYTIRQGEPFGYDWENWPRDLGAPVDETGNPAVSGDATIWSIYNEARIPAPEEPTRWTAPLGIEVDQTTWAEASGTPLGDIVFQRYRIRNAGSNMLEDAYVAWDFEPTTWDYYGGHVAIYSRDWAACDTTLDLSYAYSDVDWSERNVVGLAVLRGPTVTISGVTDTLGLTAYQDGYFTTALAAHYLMRGYRANGLPRHEYDDPSGPVTPYAYSGDPVLGTGWLYPWGYGEIQLMASSGPFRLAPGEEQEVVIALIGATGNDQREAIGLLRDAARTAKESLHRYTRPAQNQSPTANAGGPYSGRSGVPVSFDGTGSQDPEGLPLAFQWTFGDGTVGAGSQPFHTYAQDGSYPVVLAVSDGAQTDSDSTFAEIATIDTAAVALLPSDPVIRLQSARPLVWMSLEPRDDALRVSDIALGTVTLSRPDRPNATIRPVIEKAKIEDKDRDGIEEVSLPFAKQDLRILFADLPAGPNQVAVTVRGQMEGGGSIVASSVLRVDVSGKTFAAAVTPNPARGAAMLTFHTTQPGHVRVSIFDVSGRRVRVLLDQPAIPAGYHDVAFSDRTGALPSGIYFYRVEAVEGMASGRVLVLK